MDLHIPSGEITLVANTAKTVLQVIAPTNQRLKVGEVGVFFKDTVSTDTPVRVRLVRQSTAIGGTPAGATIVKNNPSLPETIQTTAQVYGGSPTEPTTTDVLKVWEVPPTSGLVFMWPFGKEVPIPGGGRLAIECLAVQAQTVSVNVQVEE